MDNYNKLTEKYGMTPEEYTMNFLDEIDFDPYFEEYDDPYEIMNAIDTDYHKSPKIKKAYDLFEDNVFNWLNTDEFIEYVNERYKNKYRFEIHINYILKKL